MWHNKPAQIARLPELAQSERKGCNVGPVTATSDVESPAVGACSDSWVIAPPESRRGMRRIRPPISPRTPS